MIPVERIARKCYPILVDKNSTEMKGDTIMTEKEFAEMMIEDEHQVQGHPCCANCKHCFVEYGMTCCYYEGEEFVPENFGSNDAVCKMWRSDVSGMTHEEYLEKENMR